MTSKFVEIVPPSHRKGNCIPFAAIRWDDFGDRPSFGRPFCHLFRHPDTPLLSFSLGRRFPRPTPERSWSQIIDQVQDFPQQFLRHGNLGQLERDVPAMADHLRVDLDQLLSKCWQRPMFHRLRRHPPPAPTERSVRISRTTLFGEGFTAQRMPGTAGMAGPGVVAVAATAP